MKHAVTSVSRGAFGGLTLAAFGGALVLGVLSILNATRECAFPGTLQCLFEEETYTQVARLQAFAAAGLALVGGGLALFRRRST